MRPMKCWRLCLAPKLIPLSSFEPHGCNLSSAVLRGGVLLVQVTEKDALLCSIKLFKLIYLPTQWIRLLLATAC